MVALRNKNGGIAAAQVVNEKDDVEFAGVKPGDYSVSVYGQIIMSTMSANSCRKMERPLAIR
jgi:hypothetical protein